MIKESPGPHELYSRVDIFQDHSYHQHVPVHRLFKDGNPIIYGGAVNSVHGTPKVGEDVLVKDHQGNIIGRGFFNPHSQYRVRMIGIPLYSRKPVFLMYSAVILLSLTKSEIKRKIYSLYLLRL